MRKIINHLRALRVLFFAVAVGISGGALAYHNDPPPTVEKPDKGHRYETSRLHAAINHYSLPPELAKQFGLTGEALFNTVKSRVNSGNVSRAESKFGFTPLHVAALHADGAVINLLVKKGANLEAKDKKGRTPLFLAAEFGDPFVVKALLDAGAQYGIKSPVVWHIDTRAIKDTEGRTILHAAALNPNNPAWILNMLIDLDRITPIGAGLDRDGNGNNVLHYAASNLDGRLAHFAIREIFSKLLTPDESKWGNIWQLKLVKNAQGHTPYDQAAWLHEQSRRYDRSYGCVVWGFLGTCKATRPVEILRLLETHQ